MVSILPSIGCNNKYILIEQIYQAGIKIILRPITLWAECYLTDNVFNGNLYVLSEF